MKIYPDVLAIPTGSAPYDRSITEARVGIPLNLCDICTMGRGRIERDIPDLEVRYLPVSQGYYSSSGQCVRWLTSLRRTRLDLQLRLRQLWDIYKRDVENPYEVGCFSQALQCPPVAT